MDLTEVNPSEQAIIEVISPNRTFFRKIAVIDLVSVARQVRWNDLTAENQYDVAARNRLIWDNSESVAISDTGAIDYSIVDHSHGVEEAEEAWKNLYDHLHEDGLL